MINMQGKSDNELIAAYLGGNKQALEILVGRYFRQIYGFVGRYAAAPEDTEDLTQEVFVKAWRHLKTFDREMNFKTWLFAIAKNTALDLVKKKKAVPFSTFETDEGENPFLESLADKALLPHEILERQETGAALKALVRLLPPKQQEALLLRHRDDLTFRAIAERLAEPLHTVKSRHRRGIAALEKLLVARAEA